MKIERGGETLYETPKWDNIIPYALHIGLPLGIAPELITNLIDLLTDTQFEGTPVVYADGNGWNDWADAVGVGINDKWGYHVAIAVNSPRHGQRIMADLLDFQFGYGHFLPIEDARHPQSDDLVPVIAVITDGQDWYAKVHDLAWEHGFKDQEIPTGVYFSMWPKGRKAYHIEISDDDGADLENWLFSRSAEIVDVVDIPSGTPQKNGE